MFELRLRIILALLILLMVGLVGRAFQLQVVDRADWQGRAQKRAQDSEWLDTTRGRILDIRGRELAVDDACIDACVDYRAIGPEPEAKWVREQAMARLKGPLLDVYQSVPLTQRRQMIDDQMAQVRQDIKAMWTALGNPQLTGCTPEQIEQTRQQIIQRVEMRCRYVWYASYASAVQKHEARAPLPWYSRWLSDELDQAPQLDEFDVTVGEQRKPHVILPAITPEVANYLGKNADRMPGLVLRPGRHRQYPYGATACQVIGYLNRFSDKDVDKNVDSNDELTKYLPGDLAGRGGVEALAESVLRGRRGRIIRRVSDDAELQRLDPVAGSDVQLTIDIELQRKIEERFAHPIVVIAGKPTPDPNPMYGAAVVIDVPTGRVLAMASYPTYDLNNFDQLYSRLVFDDVNRPLTNRATLFALEPGSTVKPIVGIAGLTDGKVRPYEGIECTGYLVLNGHKYREGKCWTASKVGDPMHHPVPFGAEHHGTHGNADGFLTYPEALERSCNVYFETVADRLGIDLLSAWMKRFGLGRPTGIGLPEAAGRLPNGYTGPAFLRRMTTWSGGIGQGHVAATPIQMANVAATIARDGLWIRPKLTTAALDTPTEGPEREQIPANATFFALAREGMFNVVNGKAGTGRVLQTNKGDVLVAGKTGTAQAARFSVPQRDEKGQPIKLAGRTQFRFLEPSTSTKPNPEAPWYRGSGKSETELSHAWFIGFAPADHPRIAFAVLVEYGGSGGPVAGSIAQGILDAAIEEGYLADQNH